MTSARRLFRLHLWLASAGVAVVAIGLFVALTRIQSGLPSIDALVAACRRVVPLEPGLGSLVVVGLAAAGLVVVALAGRSLARQVRGQRHFLKGVARSAELEVGGRELVVVDDARPEAFCAGFLRPRIYVSSAALERLSEDELEAVVAHEAHHQRSRDPLRILIATVLADALFFTPVLRRLSIRYRELAELAADEVARDAKGTTALASALLIFGERRGETLPVVGIAPERVDHLSGQSPRWQLPPSMFVGSLVVLIALGGLTIAAPALVGSGSLSPAAMLSELCMVGMVAVPVAILAGVGFLPRGRRRRSILAPR